VGVLIADSQLGRTSQGAQARFLFASRPSRSVASRLSTLREDDSSLIEEPFGCAEVNAGRREQPHVSVVVVGSGEEPSPSWSHPEPPR